MIERRPEHRITVRNANGGENVFISYGIYKEAERNMHSKPGQVRIIREPLSEVETEDGRTVLVTDENQGIFEIDGVQFTQICRESY